KSGCCGGVWVSPRAGVTAETVHPPLLFVNVHEDRATFRYPNDERPRAACGDQTEEPGPVFNRLQDRLPCKALLTNVRLGNRDGFIVGHEWLTNIAGIVAAKTGRRGRGMGVVYRGGDGGAGKRREERLGGPLLVGQLP